MIFLSILFSPIQFKVATTAIHFFHFENESFFLFVYYFDVHFDVTKH